MLYFCDFVAIPHHKELGFAYLSIDDVYEELPQKHHFQDRVNHIETITIASDDGSGWSVADRSPMQALHNSRTKTRNSSVHETITAYRLWYRCDSSDSETGANLKVLCEKTTSHWGFILSTERPGEVLKVHADAACGQFGVVCKGDVIVGVNGVSCKGMTAQQVIEEFKKVTDVIAVLDIARAPPATL